MRQGPSLAITCPWIVGIPVEIGNKASGLLATVSQANGGCAIPSLLEGNKTSLTEGCATEIIWVQ